MSDIVTELRAHRDIDNNRCCECGHWTDHDNDCMVGRAADEIERLRAENERLDGLLIRQESVMSDSDIVTRLRTFECRCEVCDDGLRCEACEAADEIERLRAELQSQTFWAELLAGNNCYCPPDDTFVCLPCAYRQTMLEARRG